MSFIESSFNNYNSYPQYPYMSFSFQNEAQGDETEISNTSTTPDTIYHFIDQQDIRTTSRKIRRESAHLEKHRKVEKLKNETVKEKQKSAAQKFRENQIKKTEELESEVQRLKEEIQISQVEIKNLHLENMDLNAHLMFLRNFLLENLSPNNLLPQTEESETGQEPPFTK